MNANHCEDCQERLPGLVEGFLEEEDARLVRAHLEACEECRREYEWLSSAVRDLELLGDAIVRNAPEVDLLEAVLKGIDEIDAVAAPPQPIPFRRARPLRWAAAGIGWAAMAAGLAALVWLGVQWRPTDAPQVATEDTPETVEPSTVVPADSEGIRQQLQERREKLNEQRRRLRHKGPTLSENIILATDEPKIDNPSRDDILNKRKAAISGGDAFAQLMEWATLSPEQARKIVDNQNANELAVIGAAESLDSAEAAQVLTRVVGHYPENPYARFALAKEMGNTSLEQTAVAGSNAAEAASSQLPLGSGGGGSPYSSINAAGLTPDQYKNLLKQIADLKALDPENALGYYMEALARLQRGELEAGQQLLQQAQERPRANAYSFLSAQYTEQALIAEGMDPQSARLLTALTAGGKEADYLESLGYDLLEFGRSLLAQGSNTPQAEAAISVFEATRQFGEQIAESASFSSEQMAGLELQDDAGAELESLYQALGYTSALAELSTQMEQLSQSMDELRGFFDFFNQLLDSENMDWGFLSDLILNNGDLSLPSLL